MDTRRSCSRPFSVLLALERLNSKVVIFLASLSLLNCLSSGQLVPSLEASLKPVSLSNTSVSSRTSNEYAIYSVVEGPALDSENEKIRLHLGMLLAASDVQEYGGDYTGVEFWRVTMSDAQRTAFVSANPRAQVYQSSQLLYHEDRQLSQSLDRNVSDAEQSLSQTSNGTSLNSGLAFGTVYQPDAPSDLKVVSWAPGVPLGRTKAYAYDPRGGVESTIYIIENGIDGRNREFLWPPPEWLYAPSVKQTETDDDPLSHGSCVASKAIGAKNGVSKTSQLIVVKSSLNVVDIAWSLQRIVNDVAKQKNRRVVVLLAATTKEAWRQESLQDARFSRLFLRMKNLIDLGAVVVVPAGNYGPRSFFADTAPAVFAARSKIPGNRPLPLLVAGSVDNKGAEVTWSQNTLAGMAWAPGEKVTCTKKRWTISSTESGTSVSAGMVAGLAAYFLGMKNPPFAVGGPDTAQNLIKYLDTSASWARLPGKRKVIWNRLDGSVETLSNASAAVKNREISGVTQE